MKSRNTIFLINSISVITENFYFKYIEKEITDEEKILVRYNLVLETIYENNGFLCIKELCLITGKKKSTISDHINKLEKHELVEKVFNNKDKRYVYIKLTKKAFDLKEKFYEIHEQNTNYILRNLSIEEKQQLNSILNKVDLNTNKKAL